MSNAIEKAMARFHRKDRLMKDGRPLPRIWLFSDERLGDEELYAAISRLPVGSGIVFRHYSLPIAQRRALFDRVRKVAQRRRLILVLAGDAMAVPATHRFGIHRPSWHHGKRGRSAALLSMPAHNRRDLVHAQQSGADIVFLSPAFPTRSHPGAANLGAVRFGLLTRGMVIPIIALGGMTEAGFRRVQPMGAYGWGAIDGLRAGRHSPNMGR